MRIQLDNFYYLEFTGDSWALNGEPREASRTHNATQMTLHEAAGLAVQRMHEKNPRIEIRHIATTVISKVARHYVRERIDK